MFIVFTCPILASSTIIIFCLNYSLFRRLPITATIGNRRNKTESSEDRYRSGDTISCRIYKATFALSDKIPLGDRCLVKIVSDPCFVDYQLRPLLVIGETRI